MTATDDTDNPHPGMAFTVVRPCDREVDLYIMANLGENPTFGNVHQCDVACNHTFIVQPIYDSNLILVAVPHACQHCERKKLRLEPRESHGMLGDSNVTTACVKTPLDRQKPDTCHNYHAAVSFAAIHKIAKLQNSQGTAILLRRHSSGTSSSPTVGALRRFYSI